VNAVIRKIIRLYRFVQNMVSRVIAYCNVTYCNLFGFVKRGKMFVAVCYVKEQNGLAGCRLWICFALILASTGSSIDVPLKQV